MEDCADDAAALIEVMGLGPTTVVGYSMGGPIAQLLWRRHPESVGELVLCATAARFAARRQFSVPFHTIGMGASVALSLLPAGVRRQGMTFVTRRWSAGGGVADWAAAEWSRNDPAALVQAGLALSRFDSTGWIHRIDVPTAVVVTEEDETVSPRRQKYLAQGIPGALAFPVRADHRACVEATDRFVPALVSACDAVRRVPAAVRLTD